MSQTYPSGIPNPRQLSSWSELTDSLSPRQSQTHHSGMSRSVTYLSRMDRGHLKEMGSNPTATLSITLSCPVLSYVEEAIEKLEEIMKKPIEQIKGTRKDERGAGFFH